LAARRSRSICTSDNADAWIERAVAVGATVLRPAADAFYGERSGSVRDPFGHEWLLGHQIEEVSPEEMQRRYTACSQGRRGCLSQAAALARLARQESRLLRACRKGLGAFAQIK
jgi:hypothetical protein